MKKIIILGVLFLCGCFFITEKRQTSNIEKNVIRFHVRANSDSSIDQERKLKVRDALVDYLRPAMDQVNTKEEALQVLEGKKKEIQKVARNVLKEEGDESKVAVSFPREEFPEKTYGQYTFPKGTYDALRVDIGAAAGHNWWCVMFPDLCVTKDDKVEIHKNGKKALEKVLGKETVKSMAKSKYTRWLFTK